MEWKDVGEMDRNDLFSELEEIALNAEDAANAGVYGSSESYSWARYAEAVRAAIQKLKDNS